MQPAFGVGPTSAARIRARTVLCSPAPAILAIVLLDAAWCHLLGLRLMGVAHVIAAVSLLGGLTFIYTVARPHAELAEMSAYAALWVTFAASGCVLTYLCASLDVPLRYGLFQACDRMLRFDRRAWAQLLHEHPAITSVLCVAHGSLFAQVAGSVVFFALVRARDRNAFLLGSAVLRLPLACAISGVLPALGPAVTIGVPWPTDTRYVPDVPARRAGGRLSPTLADLQGIICFPSYHTVMAILLTRAHRRLPSGPRRC